MGARLLLHEAQQSWEDFYREEFGLNVDLARVFVPGDPGGFERIVVVAENVTVMAAIRASEKYFKIATNLANLDEMEDERTTRDGSYAIRVREGVEPDQTMAKISAGRLNQARIPTMTLNERLIYGLKYFLETGTHLDRTYWMLCSGTRTKDGRVPRLRWQAGYRLRIIRATPDVGQLKMRSRMVIDQ